MSDFASTPVEVPPAAGVARAPTKSHVLQLLLRRGFTVFVAALALAGLLHLLVEGESARKAWLLQTGLCSASLLAAGCGALHRRRVWAEPLRGMLEAVPQAQRGEAPIESLGNAPGRLAPLVPVLQDLLRDLRQQKAAVAALEAEVRQKVAQRTDALERTIGSLRRQATRDALTGLFNRRFLDEYLPQAVQRCGANRTELCLLMIDVDHFKILNDTLGHAAGDALLKAVGQLIRCTIRGEDVAFRYGGDEFLILMPGCDAKAGRALAERLISLVDALARTVRTPRPPRLSIGQATWGALARPSVESLIIEADKHLYAVKASRRDADLRGLRRIAAAAPISTVNPCPSPAS